MMLMPRRVMVAVDVVGVYGNDAHDADNRQEEEEEEEEEDAEKELEEEDEKTGSKIRKHGMPRSTGSLSE